MALSLTPQQYFRQHDLKPRKRFGQHFLVHSPIAERIVASADLEPTDTVVEVGPGLGALTRFIFQKVERLDLVELDRDLAAYLEENVPLSACKVFVHPQDVLTFDFQALSHSESRRLIVLGNLPYNISSPLVFHLLEAVWAVKRAVFMVQKEVGERLAAIPGTKDYGVLSVLLGACAEVTPLFTVGPRQFYPPPKVDSMVLRIDFNELAHLDEILFHRLRKVVNVAFQQRRKTLQNSLKPLVGQDRDVLKRVFAAMDLDPMRRPETLSSEDFLNLARALRDLHPLDVNSAP